MRLLIALRPYAYIVLVALLLAWGEWCLAAALAETAHAQDYAPAPAAEVIHDAAARWQLDSGRLARLALCESGLNPVAVSHDGRYLGLYQWGRQSWAEVAPQLGYPADWSLALDPFIASDVTAYALSLGQSYRWPACWR